MADLPHCICQFVEGNHYFVPAHVSVVLMPGFMSRYEAPMSAMGRAADYGEGKRPKAEAVNVVMCSSGLPWTVNQMPSRTEDLPSVARRMTAGEMLIEGASVSEVAETMQLSTDTVRRYKVILDEGGLEALKKMRVGGRSSVLNAEALEWIAAALRGSARDHGFPGDSWTNSRLRELIATRFGVRYSRVYVWQIATNLGLGHRLSKSSR